MTERWITRKGQHILIGSDGSIIENAARKAAGLNSKDTNKLIGDWTNDATKYRELDEKGKAQDMIEAIGSQPEYKGLAYRGMIVDKQEYKSMMENDKYEIKGLSSFSSDKRQTHPYSDPTVTGEDGIGVILRSRISNARDIQNSGEIVVRKSMYKIVSRTPDPTNPKTMLFVMDEIKHSVWK